MVKEKSFIVQNFSVKCHDSILFYLFSEFQRMIQFIIKPIMLKFYQHGLIKTEKQRRTNDMKKSEKAMGVLIGFIYVVLAGGWIASGIHYKSFALMLMQTSKIGIVYYVLPPVAIVFSCRKQFM